MNCGEDGLTLGQEAVEIPIVVPMLPGTASFGMASLGFEFYNGDNLLLTKKNTSAKQPERNKKLLFPVWEFSGAATGADISAQIAAAIENGSDQLILTGSISGDQTISCRQSMPATFLLSAPFVDGTITVIPAEGGNSGCNFYPSVCQRGCQFDGRVRFRSQRQRCGCLFLRRSQDAQLQCGLA